MYMSSYVHSTSPPPYARKLVDVHCRERCNIGINRRPVSRHFPDAVNYVLRKRSKIPWFTTTGRTSSEPTSRTTVVRAEAQASDEYTHMRTWVACNAYRKDSFRCVAPNGRCLVHLVSQNRCTRPVRRLLCREVHTLLRSYNGAFYAVLRLCRCTS